MTLCTHWTSEDLIFLSLFLFGFPFLKILLYISSVGMIASMAVLGAFFYMKKYGDISGLGWMPLTCLVIYVLSFSLGFGPIPWLMMGEILPAKIRGPAASVATGFNWSCTFIVTASFTQIVGMWIHSYFFRTHAEYTLN